MRRHGLENLAVTGKVHGRSVRGATEVSGQFEWMLQG